MGSKRKNKNNSRQNYVSPAQREKYSSFDPTGASNKNSAYAQKSKKQKFKASISPQKKMQITADIAEEIFGATYWSANESK